LSESSPFFLHPNIIQGMNFLISSDQYFDKAFQLFKSLADEYDAEGYYWYDLTCLNLSDACQFFKISSDRNASSAKAILRLIFYLYNGSQSQFEQGRNENC
jgi:hypothetical protein